MFSPIRCSSSCAPSTEPTFGATFTMRLGARLAGGGSFRQRVLYSASLHRRWPIPATRSPGCPFRAGMTDRALNDRLRQKSRRSGLAIGFSMFLSIVLFLAAAAFIYAALMPVLSDIIPIPAPQVAPRTSTSGVLGQNADQQAGPITTDNGPPPARPADAVLGAAPTPALVAAAEPTPTPAPEPTKPPFEPTYQVGAQRAVNLRPKPSSENAPDNQPIRALQPATPLEYLNEDQPTNDPNDAPRWVKFRTEDGEEGWIRELDTVPYRP